MLLSEGHVSLQMSEELMAQWDSAPFGKKVSRHSVVWVCCGVSTSFSETNFHFVGFLYFPSG